MRPRLDFGPTLASQFDRFNFSDESLVVVGKERTNLIEHGITESTAFQNVTSFATLDRLVRL